jgi:hypothetical protein
LKSKVSAEDYFANREVTKQTVEGRRPEKAKGNFQAFSKEIVDRVDGKLTKLGQQDTYAAGTIGGDN